MNKQDKIEEIYKKISDGHPVMIGDVLDYFEDQYSYGDSNLSEWYEIENTILYVWANKRKPIEMQDDECIDTIYNLIK